METTIEPQVVVDDSNKANQQSGIIESNVTRVSFTKSTYTTQHHGDSSTKSSKNGGNLTTGSDEESNDPPNLPHRSPLSLGTIEVARDSPRQRNLAKISETEKWFEDGYDSDGEKGPFMDAVDKEGEQDFEERALTDNEDTSVSEDVDVTAAVILEPEEPTLTNEAVSSMNKKTLQAECKRRNLRISGNKDVLQARLRDAIGNNVPIGPPVAVAVPAREADEEVNAIPTGFPEGTHWKILSHESMQVVEPSNPTFNAPRAPTVPEEDAKEIPTKHNFIETFDRPVWQGRMDKPVLFASGIQKKNRDGTDTMENVSRVNGCVNPAFIKKHNLSMMSTPEEFIEVFFPYAKNPYTTGNREYISFALITKWTNLKAVLAGAGPDGTIYPDFTPFTIKEVRQHLGLYIFNGLTPSPRVEYKFKPQREDVCHGNDFIYHAFGPRAAHRHKEFKAFLAYQNPAIDTPSKTKFPNWKVRPLILWMNYIFPRAWNLGQEFSIDEMTIGFQGRHRDKRRITYKRAGDGFQCDALCENGYTYQVYFRNHPAPAKYLQMKLSPLHCRVMSLFDTLQDRNHICGMDNLYNSATFCRNAYTHDKRVLVHGVVRKGMRGVPAAVKQEEVKNRKKQIEVRGTVKVAVLQGDKDCPNLVVSSIYDTKPVHFMSMVCTEIKWVEKIRKVYNVDTGMIETMKFLRMNNIDHYNHSMGHVDLSDQLRDTYRMNYWIRNRKWWWSYLLWGLGVQITNAYVMYKTLNLQNGAKKTDLISHHDFIKSIAVNWINSDNDGDCASSSGTKRSLFPKGRGSTRRRQNTAMSTSTSVSSLSVECEQVVAPNKRRASTVNDTSLQHTTNLSKIRLDSSLRHYPQIGRKNARCALHRWLGYETEKDVYFCPTCNVNLCVPCNKIFHTTPDIMAIRNLLKNKYKPNNK